VGHLPGSDDRWARNWLGGYGSAIVVPPCGRVQRWFFFDAAPGVAPDAAEESDSLQEEFSAVRSCKPGKALASCAGLSFSFIHSRYR